MMEEVISGSRPWEVSFCKSESWEIRLYGVGAPDLMPFLIRGRVDQYRLGRSPLSLSRTSGCSLWRPLFCTDEVG
jgi:hypothetical protein